MIALLPQEHDFTDMISVNVLALRTYTVYCRCWNETLYETAADTDTDTDTS